MIVKSILPEDLTARPGTVGDIEQVYELIRTCELVDYGLLDDTLEQVRTEWTGPRVNLAEDSLLAFDQAGRLVGYVRLGQEQYAKFSMAMRVHPEYGDQRLDEYLVEWAEAWARERMGRAEPGTRVTLGGWRPGNDQRGRQAYERAGLREIRRFWRMDIEMNEAPPAPVWPEGIELRPYVPGRDERLAFEIIDTAFQDHWGHIANRYEEWRHWMVERERFDPSLWFIAYQGGEAVGGAFCSREDLYGWVDDLAVLRPARGKGLGTALLLHAFGEFYRRGQQRVGLGVDTQNLTGALRIYQRAGMHKVLENVSYEKELRAGVELSTRELKD